MRQDLTGIPTSMRSSPQRSAMRGRGRRFATLTPGQARTVETRVKERLDNARISRRNPYQVLVLSGKRVNLRHN